MTLGNNEGKEENADNQHFLLFPQCFLPFKKQISVTLVLSSANTCTLNLDWSKFLLFCKELKKTNFEVNP